MAILSVGQIGYINGTGVRVRQTPVNGNTLYTATINDEVQCQATQYGSDGYTWLKVLNTTDNTKATGWVREDLVRAGGYIGGNTGVATDGEIEGSGVRVRTGPGTSYGTLTFVSNGDRVTYYVGSEVYANGYTWVRCTSSLWLANGYIASEYVKPYTGGGTDPGGDSHPPHLPYINAAGAPLRVAANSSAGLIATLAKNTEIQILATANGSLENGSALWYEVLVNPLQFNPQQGYVHSRWVTLGSDDCEKTSINYLCDCGYHGKLAKKVVGTRFNLYDSCVFHPNCTVEERKVLISGYCPWCGTNYQDLDVHGLSQKHIGAATYYYVSPQYYDFVNPNGEFSASEISKFYNAMEWPRENFAEKDLNMGTFTGA